MKMKNQTIFLIGGLAIIITSAFDILSDNGKAGYTGSANELLCDDCHSTYGNSNSRPGTIYVTSTMNNWQYVPGQTYTVNVIVKQSGKPLFGLGFEALNSTNGNAGTIQVTNANKTQIKNKSVSGVVRNNLVHQLNGGLTNDSAVFSFNWVAPATNVGNVTFYFSGVAANNNGDENSDYVYNSSKLVTPASSTGLNEAKANAKTLKAFVNGEGKIVLEYASNQVAQPRADIYDMEGRLVLSRSLESQRAGDVSILIDRPLGLNAGIYMIALLSGEDVYTTKIKFN
jgi:hypothetical protein